MMDVPDGDGPPVCVNDTLDDSKEKEDVKEDTDTTEDSTPTEIVNNAGDDDHPDVKLLPPSGDGGGDGDSSDSDSDSDSTRTTGEVPKTQETSSTPASSAATAPSKPECWICYQEDDLSELIQPCRCKGSVRYVHSECLIKWLSHRNQLHTHHQTFPSSEQPPATTDTGAADVAPSPAANAAFASTHPRGCPQCRYAYRIEEQHDTLLSRLADSPYVTTVMTCVLMATLYIVFHTVFIRTMARFHPGGAKASTTQHGGGGGWLGRFTSLASFTSFTSVFTEIEIFCGLLGLVYYASRSVYIWWYRHIPEDHVLSVAEANWNRVMEHTGTTDVYSYPAVFVLVLYNTCRQVIDEKKKKLIHKQMRVLQYTDTEG